MKKIIAAIFTILILISLSSCDANQKRKEAIYVNKAQELLDSGDVKGAKEILNKGIEVFPESTEIKTMLDSIEESESFATSEKASKEAEEKKFKPSSKGCYKGTYIPNFCDFAKVPERVQGSEVVGFVYEVKDTKVFDSYLKELENRGFILTDHREEYAEYFTYTMYADEAHTETLEKVYLTEATNIDNGKLRIVIEGNIDEYYDEIYAYTDSPITPGLYYIATQSDDLLVHHIPKSGTEIFGKIPKGTVVNVIESRGNWSYVDYGNGNEGWVCSDYLKPYTSTGSSGESVGDLVGGIVDAGLGVASGVLNSLF